jgi:hypothetical protein
MICHKPPPSPEFCEIGILQLHLTTKSDRQKNQFGHSFINWDP